jgi:hypothetical protein
MIMGGHAERGRPSWRWLGFLVGSLALLSTPGALAWENDAWGARVKITFDNSGQAQNLDNFPVLIRLDSSRIQYFRTQDAGQDIRFVDDDDATVLDHEIELWDESGTSYVWVRVPRINALSSADFIYMYYDNVNAADGQNPPGVWNLNYRGVWHLSETVVDETVTAGVHTDSTSLANHGTQNNNDDVAGQIAGAQNFDASGDWIGMGNPASLADQEPFSIEAWIKTPGTVQSYVVSKRDPTASGYWRLNVSTALSLGWLKDTTTATQQQVDSVNGAFAVNAWQYIVLTWDGTLNATGVAFYVNGSQVGLGALQQDGVGGKPSDAGENFNIGSRNGSSVSTSVAETVAASSSMVISTKSVFRTGNFPSTGSERSICR